MADNPKEDTRIALRIFSILVVLGLLLLLLAFSIISGLIA